jgi:hypothetical protein
MAVERDAGIATLPEHDRFSQRFVDGRRRMPTNHKIRSRSARRIRPLNYELDRSQGGERRRLIQIITDVLADGVVIADLLERNCTALTLRTLTVAARLTVSFRFGPPRNSVE